MPLEFSEEAQLEIGHVLFMDIIGYSKLLVDDQTSCTQHLNSIVRSSLQFRQAEAENKLFRLPTGDGMVLVFFTSPESPVRCALEIAEGLRTDANFELRMGIHSGPVTKISDVNDRSNVAGGGINIAQRVMDCGDGGHILLSHRVAEDLEQYGRWRTLLHDLGEVEVKHGVKINVVSLHSETIGNPERPKKFTRARTSAEPQRIASLAVKPLDNFSQDPSKNYFADGMTDELITKLSHISALKRVISRSTMMRYKQSPKSTADIAAELNVEAVLEGSVLVLDEHVRVSAQLIEAATDQTLWADSYTSPLSNILQLQSDVALAIAQAIQVRLTPAEKERLLAAEVVNPKAYDYYLRGRHAYGLSKEDCIERINQLEKSIYLDGTFADAHAELSIAYSNRAYFFEASDKEWEIKAELAAEKALELNPELPAALMAQARLHWRPTSGFRHEKAIRLIHQALAVAPNSADAYIFLASVYFHVGLIEEAREFYERANGLNPGQPMVQYSLGHMLFLLGHFDEAVAIMNENLNGMVRSFVEYNIACALLHSGQAVESRKRVENAKAEFKDEGGILTAMQALFCALDGDKVQADEKIRESVLLGEGFGHFHHTAQLIAAAYAVMDVPGTAMEWLTYMVENGYPNLRAIKDDPNLDKLRDDPRFIELSESLMARTARYQALADRHKSAQSGQAPNNLPPHVSANEPEKPAARGRANSQLTR